MLKPGKLEKVEVHCYTDPLRSKDVKTVTFLTNPSEVSSRHENQFSRLRGINTSGRSAPYANSYSDILSLQLIIDDTINSDAPIPGVEKESDKVEKQVTQFLNLCAYMDGEIHEPRYLKVHWGAINFDCRLRSVEVKYTRFDEKGNPLRAELDTVFIADMPDEKRIRLENKKSPDITHTRSVAQGDTLPGLCRQVYGSAAFFLLVASANQLNHFRNLTPGQEVFFPPLDK